MRVLLTTHQYFPQFAAGTEVLTYSVARELIKRGHTVRVLTGYPGNADLADEARFDEYDFEGIHVYRFHHAYNPMGGQVSMIEVGYNNRLGADYFDRIIERFEPDVVHFFHLNRLGTGLIERAVQAGIPRFMTPTDFWTICPTGQLLLAEGSLCAGPSAHAGNCLKHFAASTQKGAVGKLARMLPTSLADRIVRLTQEGFGPSYKGREEVNALADRLPRNVSRLNRLNGILVPNRFMKDFLVRHGVVPGLISEAAFGIDLASNATGERPLSFPGRLRIGFIGTLAPHKGCHVLIEAYKNLAAPDATLKIYGRSDDFPAYAAELESRARRLPSIEFCGTFPNSEIGQVLASLDVLVVPSLWYENTPLVIYSAQAARCPVIASDLPGLSEAIGHDENGLLFKSGDSAGLARQLGRLINEDGLLQQLSARARRPESTECYVDQLLAMWRAG